MYKFTKFLAAVATCSVIFSTTLTAHAQSLNGCTFTESEKQAALSCIEETADSFDSAVTYAIDDYSKQTFNTDGADVEQGCIVRTVRNDMAAQYYENGDFLSAVYGEPMYLVPVSNGDVDGTILLKKGEMGKLEFYGQYQSTGLESADVTFDLSAVDSALSTLKNVQTVQFVQNEEFGMNMVYAVTDTDAYIIPYYLNRFSREYADEMPEGQPYSVEDFMYWVDNTFVVSTNGNLNGGLVAYKGLPSTNHHVVQEVHQMPIHFWVCSVCCIIFAFTAIGFTVYRNKSKRPLD